MNGFQISGNIVDIPARRIFAGNIEVLDGKIAAVKRGSGEPSVQLPYIIPGFIDSHVHIESSMLVPAEFARLAVVHGTVATVSDPHEIANVCGSEGVEFMIDNGNTVPFKFYFGAPSCVPATTFETSGATLDSNAVESLLNRKEIRYLSEMMNFPGVINGDGDVIKKIRSARDVNKPIDGHAPGLMGEAARKYFSAGISTDHECFTLQEALEKLKLGVKILIREGSAAKNFDALIPLLSDYPQQMMFCSDDKHPDSLVEGHINHLCARAVATGIDVFDVLLAACVNPVLHYKLDVGLLKDGDPADFILVKDLEQFEVVQTYINGQLVAENGGSLIKSNRSTIIINNFDCKPKAVADFRFPVIDSNNHLFPVIEALDGQLITNRLNLKPSIKDGAYISDTGSDILKLVVLNRYRESPIAFALIKGFGITKGAMASSVAHDSHNIVAVGADDESIAKAVNLVIEKQGGISCCGPHGDLVLPLPVAGLMSDADGYHVSKQYIDIDAAAKALGSTLASPFMTLSFMALLVIPHLKLSDKGLFDGDNFRILFPVER